MATKCPNKQSAEWQKLVSNLGETTAYKVFLANNEEVPEMSVVDDIINNHYNSLVKIVNEDKYSYTIEAPAFIWKKISLARLPLDYTLSNTESLEEKIKENGYIENEDYPIYGKINNENEVDIFDGKHRLIALGNLYPNRLIKIELNKVGDTKISNDRWVAEKLNLNKSSIEKYTDTVFYKQSDSGISQLINDYKNGQISLEQYRQLVSAKHGIPEEYAERALRKYEIFSRFVPDDVIIVFDETLQDEGYVDKRGDVYTITLNPLLLSKDAVGHEFGHILLSLMNGMRNPLIKQAREQLRDTKLERKVLETYNGRYDNPEKLDLEVIAYALGHDVTKLVENEEKLGRIQRILNRIYEWFRTKLGLERNAVRRLSLMMLQGKTINDQFEIRKENNEYDGTSLTDAALSIFSKKKKELEKDFYTSMEDLNKEGSTDKLSTLVGESIEVLERKVKIYSSKSKNVPVSSVKTYLSRIKETEDPMYALYNFVELAYNNTKYIYTEYLKKRSRGKITIKLLEDWKDYVNGFKEIERIKEMLFEDFQDYKNKNPKDAANPKSRSVFSDRAFNMMKDVMSMKATIENVYILEGSNKLAEYLAPYHKHWEIQAKDTFQREYYALSKEQKMSMTEDEYVDKKMSENASSIKTATFNSIKTEILKAGRDVNQLTRWLETIVDSSDPVVASVVKAFTIQDRKALLDINNMKYDLIERLRDLESFYKANGGVLTDPTKIFDFMLEKNKRGEYTSYILSEMKGGFDDKLREQLDVYKKEKPRTVEDIKQFVGHFYKINGTTDWVGYEKALLEYVDGLFKEATMDEMSKKELERFHKFIRQKKIKNTWWTTEDEPEIDITEILTDSQMVAKVQDWIYENKRNYYKVNEYWINDSKEYKALKKILEDPNDPRTKFYNYIVETSKKLQHHLPYSQRLEMRIPAILKGTGEYFAKGEYGKGIKSKVERSTGVTLEDQGERDVETRFRLADEEGNPLYFLPVYFNQATSEEVDGETKIKDNISLDLGTSFLRFFKMAIDYRYKKDILPQVEMARYFINNRQYIERDSKGNPVINALDPDKKKASTSQGNAKLAAMFEDWLKSVFYGIRQEDEGTVTLPFTNIEIDVAKGIDMMNSYTAINMLGLNVVQGTANALLGHATNWVESFGGQFYNPKDFAKADLYYTRHMVNTLGDVGKRKAKGIVNLLNDEFDTLHEYDDGRMKDNNMFKRLFKTDALFLTTHIGEHMIQSKVMLAMLNHKPAYNKAGEKIGNILEMYQVENGRLTFREDFDPVKSKWTEEDRTDFHFQLNRLLASMHGDYYHNAVAAYQRLALGRMAGLFRKFVVPGFKRRYGRKQPNTLMGIMTEGYYRTFAKFAGQLLKDLVTFNMQLFTEDWSKLTPTERANIRKTIAELTFLMASVALIMAFTKMKGDGDDDEGWLFDFASYQSYRFMAEMSFFVNPVQTMNILRSPAASITMVQNSIQLIGQLLDPIDGPFERFERGNWKGHMKIQKYATNLLAPGLKQWYRLKYIDDQINWFR